MAENTYTASMKNYRKTSRMSQYVPLDSDSSSFSDLLAFFNVVTWAGKPGRQAAVAIAAKPSRGLWARVLNGVLTYLDNGRGRAFRIEPVPGLDKAFYASTNLLINLSKEGPTHPDSSTIHFAEPGGRITWSSGAQG